MKKYIITLFSMFLALNYINNKAFCIQFVANESEQNGKKEIPKLDVFVPEEQPPSNVVEGGVVVQSIISVDDCIKMAIENNPNILSSIANKEIYKTKIDQAWSHYFPEFSVSTGYTRTKMLMPSLKNFKFNAFDYYKPVTANASLLIYDFGKTSAEVKMAKKTFEATESNVQGTINEIVYKVKEAYYNLLFAIQQEQVWEETVDRYEITYEQAKAYYEIGTKPKIDLTIAKYNLDNAKLSHIKAKNNVNMMYAELNNTMGLPEYTNYNISQKIDENKYKYEFENIIKTANETRPELISAQKKYEASEQLIKASKCAFLPDLKLAGDYSLGGTNPNSDYGYGIGGALQYQTVNLMLLKKQVDEAKATVKKDKADYETTKQNVYLEVKQAYIKLFDSEQSLPVAKSAMNTAQEQYELANGRYKVGVGDVVELKDAENTYLNAQLEYYKSILDYNISAANLEKVIGTPLEIVTNEQSQTQETQEGQKKEEVVL